jgi:hypothetical protein
MDNEPAEHGSFAGSRERMERLIELMSSDQAMSLPLGDLEAIVEPDFQALMAQLRQEYRDLQARRATQNEIGPAGLAPEADDAG